MNIPLSVFLKETAKETCRVLAELLPTIGGPDWWKSRVKSKLSYQQQRRFESGQIATLEDLDLAALMRVVDKNWFEIADKGGYPDEGRNLVKEVQQVRHRASHEGVGEPALEDLYRDLDSLKRYLAMIGADKELLAMLDEQRRRIMAAMTGKDADANAPASPTTPAPMKGDAAAAGEKPRPRNTPSQGVRLELLGREAGGDEKVRALLNGKSFIGIDFGTSTTVVSYVRLDPETGTIVADPIPIKQYDELGRCIEDHLVASCVAWTGQKILVGQGAAQLKSAYEYGKNIWFSFKMKLGVDLGPQYYRSALARGKGTVLIEKPQHVAAVFFRYLRQQIETFVADSKLPGQIVYSVSVPAAFEANQRQDLCNALAVAGIVLPSYGIIDEPNAAFISYLVETLHTGTGIAKSMEERKRRIMVFDFGAGTCDISILEVGAENGRFVSKNLAISQFHALGGDNIDRQIVRDSLLGQLASQLNEEVDFTTAELATAIIPRLQPTAEALKVQICKYVANNWDGKNIDPFSESDRVVTGNDVEPFTLNSGMNLKIEKPSLSFSGFATVMNPFLTSDESEWSWARREEDLASIFEPVLSAMEKAGISNDELDMVLFIGGSSLNPFVQSAIQDYFGRFVEPVFLSDLRTPVSRGAALNSFMVNGLGCEIIKPINSEPVYVVTLGGGLRELLPAGAEIPSEEFFVSDLVVQRDGQSKVELPICVTNEDKLLAVIEITARRGRPFKSGEQVTLLCSIDENKLLRIRAKVGNRMVSGTLVNPLANKEITPEESRMLTARQHLYASAVENNGRPAVHAMLQYAYACQDAGHFIEAAEAFEAVERLDTARNFSTQICYLYGRSGKSRLSSKWSARAYERNPCATTAFNLALDKQRQGNMAAYENLMEESLRLDPEHEPTLEVYGHYLKQRAHPQGIPMIEMAFERLKEKLDRNALYENDFYRLRRAAQTLGREDVVEQIDRKEKDSRGDGSQYNSNNLAASSEKEITRKIGI